MVRVREPRGVEEGRAHAALVYDGTKMQVIR